MRCIVTGPCGFIGSHLVDRLLADDWEVAGLDARTEVATNWGRVAGQLGALIDPPDEDDARRRFLVEGTVLDMANLELLWAIMGQSVDAVFHLAAESHVDRSLEQPDEAFRVNAEGTMVVARWCAAKVVPLVYCSTDEVYGDVLGTPSSLTGAPEHATLSPSSPYSAGKAAGEMAVETAVRSYGLRAVITRGCNAWGPRQYPEKLVPIACRLIQRGERVPLHGSGHSVRQWIHVEDFVEGLIAALAWRLRHPTPAVGRFNLAGPTRMTVQNLVEFIAAVHHERLNGAPEGHRIREFRASDYTRCVEDRPGQDREYHVCGWRSRMDLGFDATRALDEHGVREMLDAYPPEGGVNLAAFVESEEE